MSDRLHFEFRSYPLASSPEGLLLKYVKSEDQHPTTTKNDLVLKALKICGMPYAYREAGLKNNRELKKIAEATIHNLEWHIREIRSEFGLESVPPPPLASYTPVPITPETFPGVPVPNGMVKPEAVEEADETDEWVTLDL
jgi:hypothetical protein